MPKTKRTFNLLDALIVLVILAVIAALLYIFVWSEERSMENLTGTPTVPITYVVEISGFDKDFADKIDVGDRPLDSAVKSPLGIITALEAQDYYHTGTNLHDGTMVLSKVEDCVNLYITIEAEALPDGYAYTLNGSDLYVGKLINLAFDDIVCSGYCIALDIRG